MKLLDLFSGLGGFSYGLERIGFKTVAFCEMDKYCKLVLQKHWKGAKIYNDVKEITKERLEADGIELPEIITGGFPCQPFSVAGKQKGTSDDRHLWPEMFRIIKEFKPRWVIGENVKGITNIQDGMVFETVCTDLEGEGYEVRAFNIPAAGVGAPHRRERIWIVAHAKCFNDSESIRESDGAQDQVQKEHRQNDSASREFSRTSEVWKKSNRHENVEDSRRTLRQGTELERENANEVKQEDADQHQRSSSPSESNVANTERKGLEGLNQQSTTISGKDERTYTRNESSRGQTTRTDVAYTKSSDRHDNEAVTGDGESQAQEVSRDGSSVSGEGSWWHTEPDVGRVAHGIPGRVHRLKSLGNSIVPKIAEEIGKAIMEAEADDVKYQGGGAYKAMLKLFRDNLR